jgi:hypothetical protein
LKAGCVYLDTPIAKERQNSLKIMAGVGEMFEFKQSSHFEAVYK